MAKNNDRRRGRELKTYNRQLKNAGMPTLPKSLMTPKEVKAKEPKPQRYFPASDSGGADEAGGGEDNFSKVQDQLIGSSASYLSQLLKRSVRQSKRVHITQSKNARGSRVIPLEDRHFANHGTGAELGQHHVVIDATVGANFELSSFEQKH